MENEKMFPLRVVVLVLVAVLLFWAVSGQASEKYTVQMGKVYTVLGAFCHDLESAVALAKTQNRDEANELGNLLMMTRRCFVGEGTIRYNRTEFDGGKFRVFNVTNAAGETLYQVTILQAEMI